MENSTAVSVVIGSYQRNGFIQLAIESVRADLINTPHEIIVVDGGSTDGSLEWLISQKDIITIAQHNRGIWNGKTIIKKSWGYFMNLGFKIAKGKYICMLSDDCIVTPNSLINGIQLFDNSLANPSIKVGAIAFYWRNWPKDQKYLVGKTWGDNIFVNHGLYLNAALKEVSYADEDNYHFYHADGDLSLRLWNKGYSIIDSPKSFVEHYVDTNEHVRIENHKTQQADWSYYKNLWGPNLGQPKSDWIELEFIDPSEIAKKYNSVIRKKKILRQFLPLRRALSKIVN